MKTTLKIYWLLVLFCSGFGQVTAQKISLEGRITDNQGSEIPGAVITLKPSGKVLTSDEQGKYRFTGLTSGMIIINVHSIGFKDYSDSLRLSENITKDIRLEDAVNELDHFRVVGTRESNENAETLIKVKNSIMPVTIIDRRTIELMGSRRLDEVLKEQTGIAIVK